MGYNVVITPPAKRRLDKYVQYTAEILKNEQAARSILMDAKITKEKLSVVAETLKICEHPMLAKYGYRKIRFQKHKFIMVYRIEANLVIVDGMFHELQDYEGILTKERDLE